MRIIAALVVLIMAGGIVDASIYDGQYRRDAFADVSYQARKMADDVRLWIAKLIR